MSDKPEALPEPAGPDSVQDENRRAALKAGLLTAPAVLTLLSRSSLALADSGGQPARPGSPATNNGWINSNQNSAHFAADPKSTAPTPPLNQSILEVPKETGLLNRK